MIFMAPNMPRDAPRKWPVESAVLKVGDSLQVLFSPYVLWLCEALVTKPALAGLVAPHPEPMFNTRFFGTRMSTAVGRYSSTTTLVSLGKYPM